MKGWIVTALLVIGAYATFKWVTANQTSNAANGASQSPSAGAGVQLGPLSAAIGIGGSGNLVAGVPTFNEKAIANGHGDQIIAAHHTNGNATIPGGQSVYTPAFGPEENQNGGLQTW